LIAVFIVTDKQTFIKLNYQAHLCEILPILIIGRLSLHLWLYRYCLYCYCISRGMWLYLYFVFE